MDSVKADAELHIVHYNDKYQNLSEAVDKPDGLAVLGILLTIQVSTGHRIPGEGKSKRFALRIQIILTI